MSAKPAASADRHASTIFMLSVPLQDRKTIGAIASILVGDAVSSFIEARIRHLAEAQGRAVSYAHAAALIRPLEIGGARDGRRV
jgi:hypothetical protein